jgi:hypothetical protein
VLKENAISKTIRSSLLDTNVEFTHVIKVDLQDFTATEKK